MRYKTERILQEWSILNTKNPKLALLVSNLNGKTEVDYGISIMITSIFRTKKEHEALYALTDPNSRPLTSPHCSWCGVDIRSVDFDQTQIDTLLEWLNKQMVDNKYAKTAICHKIPGNAVHFHIQYKEKK